MTRLKVWAQALLPIIGGLVIMISEHALTPTEWVNEVMLVLTAVGVNIAPNMTAGVAKYAKFVISIGTTIGTLLISYFADGSYALSVPELVQLGSAVLASAGVYRLPGPQWSGTVVTARQVRSVDGS